jgi:hypothetical protein
MTGTTTTILEEDLDHSRYVSHADIVVPDNTSPFYKKAMTTLSSGGIGTARTKCWRLTMASIIRQSMP